MYIYMICLIQTYAYGVATISKPLKILGLFCKRALQKRRSSQKRNVILRSLLIVATPYNMRDTYYITGDAKFS